MARYLPISKDTLQGQGWRKYASYAFAANDTSVPVQLEELSHALPTLPLAFRRPTDDGPFELVALFSLHPARNLFVHPDGRWMGGYVPAYYRGYPFRLLPAEGSDRLLLCFDTESGLLTDVPAAEDTPFFAPDGTPSPLVQQALTFLEKYESNRIATQRAVNLLAEHNLIVPWPIQVTDAAGSEPVLREGLFRIDEAALRGLTGDALKKVQRANAMHLAYAQLFSQHRMASFSKLYELHEQLRAKHQSNQLVDADFVFGRTDENVKFSF